jgi:hypothetical protein
MPFYRVMLKGYNFAGTPIGQRGRFGLYTTRYVQALNARRAELRAVALVWRDPKLAQPKPRTDADRARLIVESIVKIERLPLRRGGGATWFPEDEPKPELTLLQKLRAKLSL